METIEAFKTTLVDNGNGNVEVKLQLPPMSDDQLPFVSILTPTGNRHHFVKLMLRNWNKIDYPSNKLEWIIVDDGDTPMFPQEPNDPRIRYIFLRKKVTLGKKRNFTACLASGEYIVHMDDDDFYAPESVIARIKTLLVSNKKCVGCNKTLCYDLLRDQTFEAFDCNEPGGKPCTISESTLAYSKAFFKEKQFRNEDIQAECLAFLKDRYDQAITIPYVFVVTQLTHGKNTIKRFVTQNTQHTTQFLKKISFLDQQLILSIRAAIIAEIPQWKQVISLVQKWVHLQAKGELDRKEVNRDIRNLPKELWTNPMVLNFKRASFSQKKTSTGRDIVWYCGPGQYFQFSNPWNGLSTNVGGSEESVIHMAKELAKRKWNVTVYCVTDSPRMVDGVRYIPYWEWLPLDRQDVTIVWRDPSILHEQRINSEKIMLDLHDVIDPTWITDEIFQQLTFILTKSKYHASLVGRLFQEKVKIIPNGIYVTDPPTTLPNHRNIIVNTSSPDRSLHALLRALPIIRREIPDAEIHWAYGFRNGIQEGGMETDTRKYVTDWVRETKELMARTEGFVDLGRLPQTEICELYKKAKIFAYGTTFPEIDCISMSKALAAGCIPVVTNVAALGEKMEDMVVHQVCHRDLLSCKLNKVANGCTTNIDYSLESGEMFDQWVACIIRVMKSENHEFANPSSLYEYAKKKYDYGVILDMFIDLC